jgi:hypothetical protein
MRDSAGFFRSEISDVVFCLGLASMFSRLISVPFKISNGSILKEGSGLMVSML